MPRTVKDLIVEIRDTTELMVDLAYSAVLFDNEDIAEEVLELEEEVNELLNQLRIASILSARRIQDAEMVSSILQIAHSAHKISEAAGDIATLVLKGFKLSEEVVDQILLHSEETIVRATVSEDSELNGKTLGEVRLHTRTGMRVIAIKRGFEWIFDPKRDTKVYKGDVLFARGDISGVPEFFKIVECREISEFRKPEIELEDLKIAVSILIDMKNLSELSVDLGYSSVIYYNEEVAHEVAFLENQIDELKYELQRWVVESGRHMRKSEDMKTLIALLEIAYSSELIADAAKGIAQIVLKKQEIHPIFKTAMEESDEVIAMLEVKENSELAGKTLGETRVETKTGMHVVAIKRGNRWITRPTASTRIFSGDILIAKGTREGEQKLRELCSILELA